MSENITVNLENLSENEGQTLIKLVEKANISKKSSVFVPEYNTLYRYIDGVGDVNRIIETNSNGDESRKIIGICFRTGEEAQAMTEKLKIHRKLQLFADEHNEYEINWDNDRQSKWLIKTGRDGITTDVYYENKFANTIYFTSNIVAEKAIEHIGEKRLLEYYFN